jgi:CBS domain-containing protein
MFKLKTHEAREIMTKGIAKLDPTDKINVALEVFKKNFLHSLLIMDQDTLVGIVTTHDIIVHLAEEKSAINQYEKKW